jgi:hypothetical protein
MNGYVEEILDLVRIYNFHLEDFSTRCNFTRFEVFTAVKIQFEVFWVVTPCSVVIGYHLQMEAAWTSETLVFYHNITFVHLRN